MSLLSKQSLFTVRKTIDSRVNQLYVDVANALSKLLNDSVFAFVSGSAFAKLSGSLQRTETGLSYLVAGTGMTVASASNGQVTVSSTGAPSDATYFLLNASPGLSDYRILVFDTGLRYIDGGPADASAVNIDDNVVACISGSAFTKLSGSLQRLSDGSAYLRAAPGLTVITGSSGQVTIGEETWNHCDRDASFVTISSTGSLPNERVLSPSTGIFVTDLGAGVGAVLVGVDNDVVATLSGSAFATQPTWSAVSQSIPLSNFTTRVGTGYNPWDFAIYWAQSVPSQSTMYGDISGVPHGAKLNCVSIHIDPATHTALPGTMPTCRVYTSDASATYTPVSDTITDGSPTVAVYNTDHVIEVDCGGITYDVSKRYFVRVAGEAGDDAKPNLRFWKCTVTYDR